MLLPEKTIKDMTMLHNKIINYHHIYKKTRFQQEKLAIFGACSCHCLGHALLLDVNTFLLSR